MKKTQETTLPTSLESTLALKDTEYHAGKEKVHHGIDGKVVLKSSLSSLTEVGILSQTSKKAIESEIYAIITTNDSISTESSGETWVIARPKDISDDLRTKDLYSLVKVVVNEEGQLVALDSHSLYPGDTYEELYSYDEAGKDTDSKLTVSRPERGGNYTWSFHGPGQIDVAVAESVRRQKHPSTRRESQERKNTLKRRFMKAIGATALLATFVPGGLIDKVADPFDDAKDTVYVAAEPLFQEHYQNTPNTDSLSPADLIEINTRRDTENESVAIATETVARLMQQLDAHQYDSIRELANQYYDAHSGDYVEVEDLNEYLQRVRDAKSNSEVMSVLDQFVSLYGMNAGYMSEGDAVGVGAWNPDTSLNDMKFTITGIINGLSQLPKSLWTDTASVGGMENYTIEIGSTKGLTGGSYGAGEIHMPVVSMLGVQLTSIIGGVEGADNNVERSLTHEFGHANHELMSLPYADNESQSADAFLDSKHDDNVQFLVEYMKDFAARMIVGSPAKISSYSNTNQREFDAENFSGILDDRVDGLAHPDVTRLFHSQANKTMLAGLIQLEIKHPGIAAAIIDHNERLIDRTVVELGR